MGPPTPDPYLLQVLRSSEFAAALTAVVVTLVATWGKDWLATRRRRKGRWGALRAEIELCRKTADGFLRGTILAPTYRAPTSAAERALPELIGDAAMTEEEAKGLLLFFAEVASLNRALDRAQESDKSGLGDPLDALALEERAGTAKLKAVKLVPDGREIGRALGWHQGALDNIRDLYTPARAIVDAHLGK